MSEDTKEEPVFICPHCIEYVIIEKLNCGIFRHGVIKTTGKQIDPHASKEICDNLFKKNVIYGCGKPFKIFKDENEFKIEKCDYI